MCRFEDGDGLVGDMIYNELGGLDGRHIIVDAVDSTRRKKIPPDARAMDLLIPVVRRGQVVRESESLEGIRERARSQLSKLHPTIRRFMNPHEYPVGIDIGLHELRDQMIRDLRQTPLLNQPSRQPPAE